MNNRSLIYLISKDMVMRREVAIVLCGFRGVSFSVYEDPRMAPEPQPDLLLIDESSLFAQGDIADLRARFWESRIGLITTGFYGSAASTYLRVDDVIRMPINAARLAQSLSRANAGDLASSVKTLDGLTPRERQVLDLVVHGSSNKEVGRVLAISPRTVEVHRQRIMQKTGARNVADLTRIAVVSGA